MIWEINDGPKAIEGVDGHGRAVPAYAAALGLVRAPFHQRALATAVELFAATLLALPGVLVSVPALLRLVSGEREVSRMLADGELLGPLIAVAISSALVTIFTVVQLLLHGRKGVTLGKALFGFRSVNVRTLERPGFWRGAVVRYLMLMASFMIPVAGPLLVIWVSPLFDPEDRGRGWCDVVAATWFVDVRRGLNPYNAKRMRIARKMLKTPTTQQQSALPSLATPVDRGAPAAYVPSGRLSGGVVGAHRPNAPTDPRPAESAPASDSRAPLVPAATAEERPAADIRAVLRLDHGERVEVRGPLLIGRAPASVAGDGSVDVLQVADETRSVSKTHLEILPARRGVVVVDRGSTNGSGLVRDGKETTLPPGEPTPLHAGDMVRFGDNTLTVDNV